MLTGTPSSVHAGNLNFKSSSYEWLIVNGTRTAQYKGVGTVTVGKLCFILTAYDGSPTSSASRFGYHHRLRHL